MRILEQYKINRFGEIYTVRLYTNGEHRCSCKNFRKFDLFGECRHVESVKNKTASFVEARRFSSK